MATQTGAADNSTAAAPPPLAGDQEKVEEKAEQVELIKPEKTDSAPKEGVEERMSKAEELSKSQDQPEDKQIDPPTEAEEDKKPDMPAPEVSHTKEEGEDKAEKKQAEPDPDESVIQAATSKKQAKLDPDELLPEAATSKMEEQPQKQCTTHPEEQVKEEIVEEKPEEADEPEPSVEVAEKQKETLEAGPEKEQGEPEVVEEKEASKEVSIEDQKPKEEATEAIEGSDSSETMAEPEKTSKTNPVEEAAEQKPENPSQEENPAEECKAPVLVDEPQSLAEDENTELKETVEGKADKQVGDEVVGKMETPQAETIKGQTEQEVVEKVEAPRAEEEVVEKLETSQVKEEVVENLEAQQAPQEVESKEQSEVAEAVETTTEEIKTRESLEALMRKDEENQDQVIEEIGSESSDKQVQVEDKDVRQSSIPEVANCDGPNDKEKDPNEPKEVEEVTEESALEVKKEEDKLEKDEQTTEDEKVRNDVTTECSIQQTKDAESGSTPVPAKEVIEKSVEVELVSTNAELPSENKIEETKQKTEATAPVENGRDEGKTGDFTASEEIKDPETKEEKTSSEPIKEREVEVVKPEESIKNADETKHTQDQSKEEAPAKPVPKQSNNIISKVKHSLVKAKKAIIGKSPSSKSISTGDIKVK